VPTLRSAGILILQFSVPLCTTSLSFLRVVQRFHGEASVVSVLSVVNGRSHRTGEIIHHRAHRDHRERVARAIGLWLRLCSWGDFPLGGFARDLQETSPDGRVTLALPKDARPESLQVTVTSREGRIYRAELR